MLTLYQTEWCPYSHRVRQVLTELGLTYTTVNVPYAPGDRVELIAIAGQTDTPVLVDGDKVYGDSDEIIEYLRAAYPEPDDAAGHAVSGAWRVAIAISLPPRAALARLEELLGEKGFRVVARVRASEIHKTLPEEHVILQVTAPVAAVTVLEVDPLAPGALMFPIAVVPTEDGKCVVAAADPQAQVWLFGDPDLYAVQSAVRKRLNELLSEL